MTYWLGIDLGTSSVRALLLDDAGRTVAVRGRRYRIDAPRPGYAEQDPQRWWELTCEAIRDVLAAVGSAPSTDGAGSVAEFRSADNPDNADDAGAVAGAVPAAVAGAVPAAVAGAVPGAVADVVEQVGGIGVTGQMHGLVCVDGAGEPVRPAIIWPDLRTAPQVAALTARLPREQVHAITGMAPSTGQFGLSLAWLAENEPGSYARTRTTVLPKDYLRFRLTGKLATEPTDACGTALFDITSGRWSDTVVEALSLDADKLPAVVPSRSVVGGLTPAAAAELGLPSGIPVIAGAGDQASASVALGLDAPGTTSVAISSGGTVVQVCDRPDHPAGNGLHVLCSADPGRWLLMGAALSAGLAMTWLAETLQLPTELDKTASGAEHSVADHSAGDAAAPSRTTDIDALIRAAAEIPPGADGLLFLPYLAGERTPHLDPQARGMFLGLRREHGRAHLTRAVLESVAFSLRDCLDTVATAGTAPSTVIASGGGARNPVWRQILTDVLGVPFRVSDHTEHSAAGAALMAAETIDGRRLPSATDIPAGEPEPGRQAGYQRRRELFRRAYRTNADLMADLAAPPD